MFIHKLTGNQLRKAKNATVKKVILNCFTSQNKALLNIFKTLDIINSIQVLNITYVFFLILCSKCFSDMHGKNNF